MRHALPISPTVTGPVSTPPEMSRSRPFSSAKRRISERTSNANRVEHRSVIEVRGLNAAHREVRIAHHLDSLQPGGTGDLVGPVHNGVHQIAVCRGIACPEEIIQSIEHKHDDAGMRNGLHQLAVPSDDSVCDRWGQQRKENAGLLRECIRYSLFPAREVVDHGTQMSGKNTELPRSARRHGRVVVAVPDAGERR